MKAADTFAHPTSASNQLWQTDFTYLRVIGWGWFYLSTVLDDFSRYFREWYVPPAATEMVNGMQVSPDVPFMLQTDPR
jgi:transposase InsO family protein